jgi:hypothetical protein
MIDFSPISRICLKSVTLSDLTSACLPHSVKPYGIVKIGDFAVQSIFRSSVDIGDLNVNNNVAYSAIVVLQRLY